MIEVYILLGLASLGYVVGTAPIGGVIPKRKRSQLFTETCAAFPQEPPFPSANTMYESKYLKRANAVDRNNAENMYKKSLDPTATGVVGSHFRMQQTDKMHSRLTDTDMDFRHNNMQPYFSKSVNQNMNNNANDTLLETFTGQSPLLCSKRELAPMFSPEQSAVLPMNNQSEFYQDRIVVPTLRNNELPMPQVRVGPGLGNGFSASPEVDDLKMRDYVTPKTVNELRVASNPKMSYTEQPVPGLGPTQRTSLPNMSKNLPETFREWGQSEMLLGASATYEKEPMMALPEVRDTNRIDTTTDYTGGAGAAVGKHTIPDETIRSVKRRLNPIGVLNPAGMHEGKGEKYDYGKSRTMMYSNERDNTTTKVRTGNFATSVKSLVMPFLDFVKPTKKVYTTDDPNKFGTLQSQFPNKPTIYDPSDTTRTTIKETTIDGLPTANLRRVALKQTVHDPNLWVAKTTIKETLIHDADIANLKGNVKVAVYNPDDVTRVTGRQTLASIQNANMRRAALKGEIWDPEDVLKTTMKQTTLFESDGNIDGVNKQHGGYETAEYEAARTQKQHLSDYDYYGDAYAGKADAYRVIDVQVPRTQQEYLVQNEYEGVIKGHQQSTVYDTAYNARLNAVKQELEKGRAPTQEGVKLGVGGESVNLNINKMACDSVSGRGAPNRERVLGNVSDVPCPELTVKVDDAVDARLDSCILASLSTNPYNLDISGVKTCDEDRSMEREMCA
jgi:hypothetical protein